MLVSIKSNDFQTPASQMTPAALGLVSKDALAVFAQWETLRLHDENTKLKRELIKYQHKLYRSKFWATGLGAHDKEVLVRANIFYNFSTLFETRLCFAWKMRGKLGRTLAHDKVLVAFNSLRKYETSHYYELERDLLKLTDSAGLQVDKSEVQFFNSQLPAEVSDGWQYIIAANDLPMDIIKEAVHGQVRKIISNLSS